MIQIFGQDELVEHILNGGNHYDYLISIGNPKKVFGRKNPGQTMPGIFRQAFRYILRLEFFDVEKGDHLGPMRPKRIPNRMDVQRAIRFYRRTHKLTSGYIFHCWRGISRSPAFALGFLYMMTGSESIAKDALQHLRPDALPLQLVIKYFDLELGSNLTAMNDAIRRERIEKWKKELDLAADQLLEELPVAEDE